MHKRPAAHFALALVIALGIAALAPAANARADELTPEKREDIQRLFKASGSSAMVLEVANVLTKHSMQTIKTARRDISAQQLAVIEREIKTLLDEKLNGPGGMLDRLVPLYANTFTRQEIRDMLAFYESPTGKKVVATMPQLMAAGQRIGADIGKELLPELKQRLTKALGKGGEVLDKLPE